MHNVARHLQVEAMKLLPASEADADAYARSAFNRYYYATFLCVRETLITLDDGYGRSLSHKAIPETLRGKVQRKIISIKSRANKIGDAKLVRECHQVSAQNLAFAADLEKAYAIRVVADYTPDARVDFRSERFTLSGVPVTEAHGWMGKANF